MKKLSIFILLVLSATIIYAGIKLPAIYGDGIVLQRDTKFAIKGWASPGEKVTLAFNNKKYNTKADN
jgi:sialate O-acetylesterase